MFGAIRPDVICVALTAFTPPRALGDEAQRHIRHLSLPLPRWPDGSTAAASAVPTPDIPSVLGARSPATSATWNRGAEGIVKNRMILRVAALALAASSTFAQTFFPAGALPDTSAIRYTQFLQALHEPSLFELANRNPSAEAYRLLWLRDNDRPASIRFAIKPSGTGWFYRHMTGGTGSTQPTGLRENGMSWSWKSRTVSFLKTVDDTGFWSSGNSASSSQRICRSHWILEGVRRGQYRVVDRCSPDEHDPVRIIGIRAMRLGNLKVHGRQIY